MTNYQGYLTKMPKGDRNFISYIFDRITSYFIKSKVHPIKNPKKILFIRNDHIGDMVLSTHLFRMVKEKFPNIEITVLADPVNKAIIEKDKYINNIIDIDLFWRRKTIESFLDYLRILKRIKQEKFDVGIDLRGSRMNIFFFLFMPKIKSRIAYYNTNGGKAFLTHPIFFNKTLAFKANLKLLEPLGILPKNYFPHIMTDRLDKKEVNHFLEQHKLKDFIIICPTTTAESKKWPDYKVTKLIKIFYKKYPKYKILIAGSPGDKEIIERLCINKNCIPLIGFNLRKLVLIFKKAKLAIAPDGGVREIASVSGTNLIALAGPVDLGIHMPFRYFKILHHKLPCYPCRWPMPCKKPFGKWCMDLISMEEVMQAIDEVMRK